MGFLAPLLVESFLNEPPQGGRIHPCSRDIGRSNDGATCRSDKSAHATVERRAERNSLALRDDILFHRDRSPCHLRVGMPLTLLAVRHSSDNLDPTWLDGDQEGKEQCQEKALENKIGPVP